MFRIPAQAGSSSGYVPFAWQKLSSAEILCEWSPMRTQLLEQWGRLTAAELDKTGHDRHLIALLIEHKYGVDYHIIENYLRNFERTMPLAA